ncbi:1790_t:CDS:2, partial [Cetraspora pellucida]
VFRRFSGEISCGLSGLLSISGEISCSLLWSSSFLVMLGSFDDSGEISCGLPSLLAFPVFRRFFVRFFVVSPDLPAFL